MAVALRRNSKQRRLRPFGLTRPNEIQIHPVRQLLPSEHANGKALDKARYFHPPFNRYRPAFHRRAANHRPRAAHGNAALAVVAASDARQGAAPTTQRRPGPRVKDVQRHLNR